MASLASPSLSSRQRCPAAAAPIFCKPFVRTAFLVQGDPRSVADLRAHAGHLDAVFPDWYACTAATGTVEERIDPRMAKLLTARGGKRFFPFPTPPAPTPRRRRADEGPTPPRRAKFARGGVCVFFPPLPPRAPPGCGGGKNPCPRFAV